jgi:aspartate ammonia-lyase
LAFRPCAPPKIFHYRHHNCSLSRPDQIAGVHQKGGCPPQELGLLDPKIAEAIGRACDDILAGSLLDEFVVDVIQGGAGTSTNMNANEVIANRALELLGQERGHYDILHPLNHVNMSQSTNDVYPTALRLTLSQKLDGLLAEMAYLRNAFARKADEFADVIKMGRTQLQDAVPMTLGQEFGAWAIMVTEDIQRVSSAVSHPRDQHGRDRHRHRAEFPSRLRPLVTENLQLTGIPVVGAPNLVKPPGYRGVCPALGRAETGGDQALEDLQ